MVSIKSFESERFEVQVDHSKSTSFRMWEGDHDKNDIKQQRVDEVWREVDVTFSNFFYVHFLFK